MLLLLSTSIIIGEKWLQNKGLVFIKKKKVCSFSVEFINSVTIILGASSWWCTKDEKVLILSKWHPLQKVIFDV